MGVCWASIKSSLKPASHRKPPSSNRYIHFRKCKDEGGDNWRNEIILHTSLDEVVVFRPDEPKVDKLVDEADCSSFRQNWYFPSNNAWSSMD